MLDYKKITANEAREMMKGDAIILDVRLEKEYNEGYINGAVLLSFHEIKEKAATALPDKDKTILTYCQSGARSQRAAKLLLVLGYTSVYDFGGIEDWPGELIKP